MKSNYCSRWCCLMLLVSLMIGTNAKAEDPKLETKTITLKHADAKIVVQLLRPYLSKHGKIDWVGDVNAVTLSDDPATVAVMQKMIEKFDVKPPQLQFVLKLISAEKTDKPSPIPSDIGPVAKQLSEVFNYNSFSVMDSALIVTEANKDARMLVGGEKGYIVAIFPRANEGENSGIRLSFRMSKQFFTTTSEKGTTRNLHDLLETNVEMKDGETAILGASKIDGDGKALISIVTMKIKK